jgi:hypothetical protein
LSADFLKLVCSGGNALFGLPICVGIIMDRSDAKPFVVPGNLQMGGIFAGTIDRSNDDCIYGGRYYYHSLNGVKSESGGWR